MDQHFSPLFCYMIRKSIMRQTSENPSPLLKDYRYIVKHTNCKFPPFFLCSMISTASC